METNLPESIPADKFKPKFDTSTLDGKIAVMQEYGKLPDDQRHVYQLSGNEWNIVYSPVWGWNEVPYNFPAEPKTKIIPFTRDTFPREAWVREKTKRAIEMRAVCIANSSVGFSAPCCCDDCISINYSLLASEYELSLDHGKIWKPCGMEVEK